MRCSRALFSCRLTAGPMAGGLLTGTTTWEMNKGEGTLISGTGVIRKPGSLVVYKDGGHAQAHHGRQGEVTWASLAAGGPPGVRSRANARLPGSSKRLPWTVKATGPGTFSVDEKTD